MAPWWCVHTDHKKEARLNIIRHLLHTIAPHEISHEVPPPNPEVLYRFEEGALTDGRLEK
jgi:lysozyme family protein